MLQSPHLVLDIFVWFNFVGCFSSRHYRKCRYCINQRGCIGPVSRESQKCFCRLSFNKSSIQNIKFAFEKPQRPTSEFPWHVSRTQYPFQRVVFGKHSDLDAMEAPKAVQPKSSEEILYVWCIRPVSHSILTPKITLFPVLLQFVVVGNARTQSGLHRHPCKLCWDLVIIEVGIRKMITFSLSVSLGEKIVSCKCFGVLPGTFSQYSVKQRQKLPEDR